MGYSIDFRKKVLEFLDNGHAMREAAGVFGIALDTINRWKQKFLKTGGLKYPPRRCRFRKVDPEKLKAFIKERPDAYLAEIGEAFGCNESAIRKIFQKLRITRKKKPKGSGSRSRSR
jgi:transposase